MPRYIITGAKGQLGMSLRSRIEADPSLEGIFADLPDTDVTDEVAMGVIVRDSDADALINCAAYTAVDQAEVEHDEAFSVNATAVGLMGSMCRDAGIPMVHISTDYVFPGNAAAPYRESDPVGPGTIYGNSKLAGEEAFRASGADGLIIRTSWLYSQYGNNFVKTMLRLGREKEEVRVVNDQYGSPTFAGDLAEAVLALLERNDWKGRNDLLHFCNEGFTTWHGFATAIMGQAALPCRLIPVSSDEWPTPARRPLYSVMSTEKARELYGLSIPHWKQGLEACLGQLTW